MVFREDDLASVPRERARDLAGQMELLPRPERGELQERSEASRGVGQVGLEQALELQERLVVESDVVEGFWSYLRLVEAIPDRMDGKAWSCFRRVKRSS